MKNSILACVGLVAMCSAAPALAADMAARPLKAAPMIVYDWTGWYVGGNVGYGGGNNTATDTVISGAAFPVLGAGFPLYGSPDNFRVSPQGVLGGAQAGYNWQSSNVVFGVEADIQGADTKGSNNCILACNTPLITSPAAGILAFFPVVFSRDSYSQKIDWFGTVRGRLGYANGGTMVYVTGGLAYGDAERAGAVNGITLNPGGTTRNTFAGSYDNSSTKVGWTAGFGGEAKWFSNPNWSVKGEYLYVDLGRNSDTFNTLFQPGGNPAAGVAATRTDTSYNREHIIRLGVNYHFNQAVVARY